MSIVDDLLLSLEEPERTALSRIRDIIRAVCPEAEEVKTYGMPGFKYKHKYLVSFASLKDHLSLFPGAHAIEVMQDELKDYSASKGTIRFTLEHQLPESLIKKILQVRINDIDAG